MACALLTGRDNLLGALEELLALCTFAMGFRIIFTKETHLLSIEGKIDG